MNEQRILSVEARVFAIKQDLAQLRAMLPKYRLAKMRNAVRETECGIVALENSIRLYEEELEELKSEAHNRPWDIGWG